MLIGKEAVDKGIGLGPLLRMAPYLIPQAMQFAVPGTMLLATTSVYGRMASYNEIVAIKSLGISPMAVVWPTLILATLVSFVAVVLNDVAVSWGRWECSACVLAVDRRNYVQPAANATHLQPGQSEHHGPRCRWAIGLIWPTLIMQASGDQPALTVSAKEAELHLLPDEGKLVAQVS